MKGELSGIQKLEIAKSTMEALGFDFSKMTVAEGFEMYRAIATAVIETVAKQRVPEWWKELVQQIRSEETLALDGKLSKIVNKALAVVEDRLDKGNFQYDQRKGELVRIPVNVKDAIKATAD